MAGKKRTDEYWLAHIKAQQNSGLCQSDYCRKHSLSSSQFSQKKNELRPAQKYKRIPKTRANRYGKGLKLSEAKIENFAELFIKQYDSQTISKRLNISLPTTLKYQGYFREALCFGALMYLELFSGVGSLVMIGKSPSSHLLDEIWKRDLKGYKNIKGRNYVLWAVCILHYTKFKWTRDDTDCCHMIALTNYCKKTYIKQNPIDFEKPLPDEVVAAIFKTEVNEIAHQNWISASHDPYCKADLSLEYEYWIALFYGREEKDVERWFKELYTDLLWVLKKHGLRLDIVNKEYYFSSYVRHSDPKDILRYYDGIITRANDIKKGKYTGTVNEIFGAFTPPT